jgi:hypothetical protein
MLKKIGRIQFKIIIGLIFWVLLSLGAVYLTYLQYARFSILEAGGGMQKGNSLADAMLRILYRIGGKWLIVGIGGFFSLGLLRITYDKFKDTMKNVTKM